MNSASGIKIMRGIYAGRQIVHLVKTRLFRTQTQILFEQKILKIRLQQLFNHVGIFNVNPVKRKRFILKVQTPQIERTLAFAADRNNQIICLLHKKISDKIGQIISYPHKMSKIFRPRLKPTVDSARH